MKELKSLLWVIWIMFTCPFVFWNILQILFYVNLSLNMWLIPVFFVHLFLWFHSGSFYAKRYESFRELQKYIS